jgi:hypothetical protein
MYLGPDATHPARRAFAVTPSDSEDLKTPARALYVGGVGNVSLVTIGGDTVTLTGLQAGSFVPVACTRVLSAGTSASNIVALA